MEPWGWLSMVFGAGLVLLSLIEIWITIYHKDLDGPMTHQLQRWVWQIMHAISLQWRHARRTILSFAGPVMVLATFALWVVLFIVGFTFIVWPNLEDYRTEDELGDLGFIDALYYVGVAGTVLGYGDITPLTPGMKIITFIISGYGFLILTGGIAYLVSVVNGASVRNDLALKVRGATGRTGDGVLMVQRMVQLQDPGDVRARLEGLASSLRNIQERLHQFPILNLFYRSRQASHDPEPMLYAIAHGALAARLVSIHEKRLRPEAQELSEAATDTMLLVSLQHLSRKVHADMENPRITDQDHRTLEQTVARLDEHLQGKHHPGDDETHLLELIARIRIFATGLDRLTAWRIDLPARQQSDPTGG